MSMYIRVKRKKTTIFLHVEPTDTVLEVKQKLQDLVEQPPEKQQLFKGTQLLEDARKLAEAKVENDDVIAMVFQQDDGSFEPIDIPTVSTGMEAA
ncbi:ubiquitin-related domain-containing protein [Dunaliella salina]|uniref:Ubiquitin-related domain-containing protein n=1 Tax=Dunaliella salina TaxID=3046 RepID=A0ABQ7G6F3_DUNSA|nr:ubiquitin-related domain-containing protein [Dunaliella salina]|mmetsp:Transcript_24002/g.65825  ORF Transcript_24002/g.65825 Transcript_24002/m.65825 type:complete len:95 (-) Transcript_24002:330-614(-)|eukprot:KAF5830190.1 ubiquitin-related domain-containing protein [Dunaliella salina]